MSKNRYSQLIELISHHKPQNICEVGTWDGHRALLMCGEALKHHEHVSYWGFDLFEDATDETDKRELNVKPHHNIDDVHARLDAFAKEHKGFNFNLVKGDTRETLAQMADSEALDFVFIDGGHSVDTIKNDYNALKGARVIVLDDFYEPDKAGKMPDTKKFGCNSLLADMDHTVLPIADPVRGGGMVRMAMIGTEGAGRVKVKVKTLNCVSDDKIKGNVRYATTLFPRDKFLPVCRAHDGVAVMVSGEPSLEKHFDDLREHQKKGHYLVSVKSAMHRILDAGITPWACMLLDPRIETLKWIQPIQKDVVYFVASMCYPDLVEYVRDNADHYYGYHALVGAGEDKVLEEYHRRCVAEAAAANETPPGDPFMISGGSTAAIRGISVLYAYGFRHFHMYAYDSCVYEEPDWNEKTKTGKPRWTTVEVGGRKFMTESQMIAQAQDFQTLLQERQMDLHVEVHGDGMIPWMYKNIYKPKPEFAKVFGEQAKTRYAPRTQKPRGRPKRKRT